MRQICCLGGGGVAELAHADRSGVDRTWPGQERRGQEPQAAMQMPSMRRPFTV